MKAITTQIDAPETEEFIEVDAFSTSISPINHGEKLSFSFRDRLCCVGCLAGFIAVMRLLLSN